MKTWVVPGAPKIDHIPAPKSDDLSKFKKIIEQREKDAKAKQAASTSSSSTKTTSTAPSAGNFDGKTT